MKIKNLILLFFLLLIFPITATAEKVDELGYKYKVKKASEIDFADGDFYISLLEGDPLSEDALYAVYESSELNKFEQDFPILSMSNKLIVLSSYPPTKFSDYYSKSQWRKRSDGMTLSLYPNKNAWAKPANPIVQAHLHKYRWQVVYNKHKNSKYWKNTASMRAQLHCHADIVKGLKVPWNIEPWRTTSNYAKVVLKKCNPPVGY